jgi:hypothetical protein
VDRASEAFQAIAKSSNDLFTSLSNLINPVTLLSGVIGAGLVAALKSAVDSFEDFALQVRDLAYISGGTVDQVVQLVNGLDMLGVSSDQVQRMLSQMARQVEAGSTAFQQLGINVQVGADTQSSTLSVFLQTINALGQMTDTTQRDAIARQLWGRTWTDMVPVLEMGSEQLMALGAASARAMTADDIARALQYHLAMAQLYQDFQAIAVEVGGGIAPVLKDLAGTWGQAAYTAWLPVKGVFQEIFATLSLTAAGVNAMGSAIGHITDAIGLTSGSAQFWDRLTAGAWNQAQSLSSSGLTNILASVTGGYTAATGAASQYQSALAGTVPGSMSPAIQQLENQLADLSDKYYALWEAASATDPEEKLQAKLDTLDAEREKALDDATKKFQSIEGTSAEDIGTLRWNIEAAYDAKIYQARLDYINQSAAAYAKALNVNNPAAEASDLANAPVPIDPDEWNERLTESDAATQVFLQKQRQENQALIDWMKNQYAWLDDTTADHQAATTAVTQQDILTDWRGNFAKLSSLYSTDQQEYASQLAQDLDILTQKLNSGEISYQTYFTLVNSLRKQDQQLNASSIQGEVDAMGLGVNQQLALQAQKYTTIESDRQTNLKNEATVLLAQAQQNNDFWAAMQSGADLTLIKLGDFWTNVSKGFGQCFTDVQQLGSSLLFDAMSGQLNNLGKAFQQFEQNVLKTFSDILSDELTKQFINLLGLTPGSTGGILGGITTLMGGQSGTGLLDLGKSIYNVASGAQSLAQMPGIIGALAQGDIGTALEDVMPLYSVISKLVSAAGLGPVGGFAPGTFFGLLPSQAITSLVTAPAEDVLGGMTAAAAAPAAAEAVTPEITSLVAAPAEDVLGGMTAATTTGAATTGATLGGIAAAAAPFAAGAAVMAIPLLLEQLFGGGSAKIDARNVAYAQQAANYIEAHPDIVPTLQAALMNYDIPAQPIEAGGMAAGGSSASTLIPGIPDYGVLLAFEGAAPGEVVGGGAPNAFAAALGLTDAVNRAVLNLYIGSNLTTYGPGIFAGLPGGNPYAPGLTYTQLQAAATAYENTLGGNMQAGGPVSPGRSYLVGEEGPELFIPTSAGQILSRGETRNALQTGGGGAVGTAGDTIIINLSANVQVRGDVYGGSGEQQLAKKIVKEITSSQVIGQIAQALNRYARQVITVRMANGGIFNPRKPGT